jgi:hypothetical protein
VRLTRVFVATVLIAVVDASGLIFVADSGCHTIRLIEPARPAPTGCALRAASS